ncbi:tIGR04097 family integral membrane protein [Firmicutes bacterium CAG:460]|nr:TIGR04086 family membrane protein [Bacillota bacterium]CDE50239.1 tIGR04097 family integral membrane protein [Firmicutes bacterium CAG:460]
MKSLLKYLGYYTIFLILLLFITSILNLVGVNSTITNLLIFLFNISLFFIFGFKNGKIATNKGYFAGLKVGGLFLLLLIIINLFTNKNIFRISTLIYYLVLVLASVFGGMLGINKKEEK